MKLFENEYVKQSIDESVPCLEWIGKKYIPSKEFRTSEEKSLELYRGYKKKYPQMEWFVDARDIGAVSPKDTQWVIDEILPQFAALGLTKEAFVVSKSALGKMTVNYYKSTAGKVIEIRMFETVEAAKNWLKECQNKQAR
jgi:hypothetical protein